MDKEGKKVKFSDGEEISYDKLLLATGSKSVSFYHFTFSLFLSHHTVKPPIKLPLNKGHLSL